MVDEWIPAVGTLETNPKDTPPRPQASAHMSIASQIGELRMQIPWRRYRTQRYLKRAMDVTVSGGLSVLLLPVMILVAVLVRATSPGTILLAQNRVGLDGTCFRMYKFRSMRADLPDGSAKGTGEVRRSDPRLTPIGGLLRAWRLDELPQLFHVVSGKMSLVGPRPEIAANLSQYSHDLALRFAMPPGCTAWTFTRGAFANDWVTRQQINVEYVRNWSILLDIRILMETAIVLLTQRNANPN